MIINFSIQNFCSIKDKQTLSFEATNLTHLADVYTIEPISGLRLLKLALVYGANASGKTTILQALQFLRDLVLEPAEKKTESIDFEPFLFDAKTPFENSILSLEFVQHGTRYDYEVEFNKKAIVCEELNFYSPNKAKVFSRRTNIENQFTEISFGSKIKKDKTFEKNLEANTLWNNTVLGGFLKTNIELPELKSATSWFAEYLRPMIRTNTKLDGYITSLISGSELDKKEIVQLLKKADFNISDLLIQQQEEDIPEGFIDFLQKQTNLPDEKLEELKKKGKIDSVSLDFEHTVNNVRYKLAFDRESQGTKRYFGFSGLLNLLVKKSILLPIDELESSLHPDLFTHFILSFLVNAKKSQLLATTHNREILSDKDVFRNDAIWFTDKNEFSATELYSLADFDSKTIRDTSSVYNAYKIGKLGGVPNLGDYFIEIADEKD